MFICRKLGGVVLVLGTFLFFSAGAPPARANGMETSPARYGSDYRQFWEELRSGGAFKFTEDTEDLLRSGQFERAFSRYLFLKAHIRGRALYTGLEVMVDQRLLFLKSQLRLGEEAFQAVPSESLKIRVRRRVRSAHPPSSSGPDQKDGKTPAPPAATPGVASAEAESSKHQAVEDTGEKTLTVNDLPPSADEKLDASPQEEQKPPLAEAEEEKPQAKEPAPPPSAWEKIKHKLKFW